MSVFGRRVRRAIGLALLAGPAAVGVAVADERQQEFWPEIDVWWRLSPAWRVSLFVPISRNIETAYREGNFIPQVDYAFGRTRRVQATRLLDEDRARDLKPMLIRGGYLGGKSLDDQGAAYTERTIFAEVHARTPIKGGVLVSHRLRTDLRWLGSDDVEFSNRWRYRLMVEKEIAKGRTSIVPYVNVEPYYDSRYDTVNRVRVIPGASVLWSPRCAIEGNVTYQHDTRSSVTNLLALNVILHVYFERRRPAQPDAMLAPGASVADAVPWVRGRELESLR
jgi:hypothetical protein